jgi:lipopolysaccharide export LptBFGC system permease protein LptF
MVVYLIPQALAIALPVGFTFGIFFGSRDAAVSTRATRAILIVACLYSVASFATLAWIMPAANQAFRELMFTQVGGRGPLFKGANELSLGELSQKIDGLVRVGFWVEARSLAFDYHMRWALSCATFVLAAFARSVIPRRPMRIWTLGVLVVGTYVGYYALMFVGRAAAIAGTVPTFVGAWLPNVMFVMIAIATLEQFSCWCSAKL